jgi:hypothetical protein
MTRKRTAIEWIAEYIVDCLGTGRKNLMGLKGFHGSHALVVTMYFMVINTYIGLAIGGIILLADIYRDIQP